MIHGSGEDSVFQLEEAERARTIIQAGINAAVLKDESLRQKIALNPKSEIEKCLNIKFDSDVNIKILDSEDTSVIFKLPPKAEHFGKLSDSQIEQIAGGSVNTFDVLYMTGVGSSAAGEVLSGIGAAVGGKAGKGLEIAGVNLNRVGLGVGFSALLFGMASGTDKG